MASTDETPTTVLPSGKAEGRVSVPGDKSISHRFAMLAALADGTSTIGGYSTGFDCRSTLTCLRALGTDIEHTPDRVTITGRGLQGLTVSPRPLDAGNSGTTMRLLAGVVAAHPFRTIIGGDASLSSRPMRRVIVPLTTMGARVGSENGRPPLVIDGGSLRGIAYTTEVPSAQVKSCVLLAGLQADGSTTVVEHAPTRDHTERALETFKVRVRRGTNAATVEGGQRLQAVDVTVPGDISSAAFWCALAAGTPGGDITIEGVGLNPTRTAVLDVFRRAGADVVVDVADPDAAEPAGSIRVRARAWNDFTVTPEEVPLLIDEIPALAALAAMMLEGRTFEVRGAAELRVKESDRISALAQGLRGLGAEIDEFDDGFRLRARPLRGGFVASHGDHRLAMAFAIAANRASEPVTIAGAAAASVSYPEFFATLAHLTQPGERR